VLDKRKEHDNTCLQGKNMRKSSNLIQNTLERHIKKIKLIEQLRRKEGMHREKNLIFRGFVSGDKTRVIKFACGWLPHVPPIRAGAQNKGHTPFVSGFLIHGHVSHDARGKD
jgi:hypothetical protein